MVSRRTRVGVAATATAVAVAGISGWVGSDEALRRRIDRTTRIWRLATRRAAHFAAVKVRGIAADED